LLLLRNPTQNYALFYPQPPLYDWRKFKFQTPPLLFIATSLLENLDHMFLLLYASKFSISYMICQILELNPPPNSSPYVTYGPACRRIVVHGPKLVHAAKNPKSTSIRSC
jgi:hypothetical protein